jgi:hypothetical protein
MPTDLIHQRPNEFRAALDFTSAETGFSARLIEKDYWCSLVLGALFASSITALVFKGGTLLSKTYANFDRLSIFSRTHVQWADEKHSCVALRPTCTRF